MKNTLLRDEIIISARLWFYYFDIPFEIDDEISPEKFFDWLKFLDKLLRRNHCLQNREKKIPLLSLLLSIIILRDRRKFNSCVKCSFWEKWTWFNRYVSRLTSRLFAYIPFNLLIRVIIRYYCSPTTRRIFNVTFAGIFFRRVFIRIGKYEFLNI